MPKRTAFDWLLEATCLALLAEIFINLGIHWSTMPDRVPHHYDIAGNPNIWGGKEYLLITPLIALGLYAFLTVASHYGGGINMPFAIDRKSPEALQILLRMSQLLKAAMVLMFAYISWAGINTALGRAQGLGPRFLPIVLAGMFGPLIYFAARLTKYRAQ